MKVVQAVSPWGVSKLPTGPISSFTITDQIETKEKDKATTRGRDITRPFVLVLVDVRGAHSQAVLNLKRYQQKVGVYSLVVILGRWVVICRTGACPHILSQWSALCQAWRECGPLADMPTDFTSTIHPIFRTCEHM